MTVKLLLADEVHVSVFVPKGLPKKEEQRINQRLESTRFRLGLARVVRAYFKQHPELAKVRLRFSP